MKNATRKIDKIAKVCLIALALSGCALPFDSRPPWQRMTPTHDPLMSVPHPNSHWP